MEDVWPVPAGLQLGGVLAPLPLLERLAASVGGDEPGLHATVGTDRRRVAILVAAALAVELAGDPVEGYAPSAGLAGDGGGVDVGPAGGDHLPRGAGTALDPDGADLRQPHMGGADEADGAGKGRLQVLHAEAGQAVPVLYDDGADGRGRKQAGQLGGRLPFSPEPTSLAAMVTVSPLTAAQAVRRPSWRSMSARWSQDETRAYSATPPLAPEGAGPASCIRSVPVATCTAGPGRLPPWDQR